MVITKRHGRIKGRAGQVERALRNGAAATPPPARDPFEQLKKAEDDVAHARASLYDEARRMRARLVECAQLLRDPGLLDFRAELAQVKSQLDRDALAAWESGLREAFGSHDRDDDDEESREALEGDAALSMREQIVKAVTDVTRADALTSRAVLERVNAMRGAGREAKDSNFNTMLAKALGLGQIARFASSARGGNTPRFRYFDPRTAPDAGAPSDGAPANDASAQGEVGP